MPLTINYTAPQGVGYDIDGQLLDIRFFYYGGFDADLHFTNDCEIANVNLQTLDSISYTDGHVYQISPLGSVMMDSLTTHTGAELIMPVRIEGSGFDSITQFIYRIAYDTTILDYSAITEKAVTGIEVTDTNGILTTLWSDTLNPLNFTSMDTLFDLHYLVVGDTITSIEFLTGSKVYNNYVLVASEYVNGYVDFEYYLNLDTDPLNSGYPSGEGYYMPQTAVSVSTSPEPGYTFQNWVVNDSIISSDSAFMFTMTSYDISLTANYIPNDYYLTLLVEPPGTGLTSGMGMYFVDDTVTITATPVTGYQFDYWHDGDSVVSTEPEYTFTMPGHDDTLTAFFSVQVFTINAEPNNPEHGSVEGGGDYEYGDTATLTATPEDGFNFIVWTEEGEVVSYEQEYIFEVTSDRDLVAHFKEVVDCAGPVALSTSNITLTSADLRWVASGDENEWEILWDTAGFDTLSQGNFVGPLDTTYYFLDGLEPYTLYDFYVRAVCNDSVSSVWSGPETFSTLYVYIDPLRETPALKIYPNPAQDELFVSTNSKQHYRIEKLLLFNMQGNIVLSEGRKNSSLVKLKLTSLASGLYYLKVIFNNNTSAGKTIIIR
ncbi:MAG: T9SS type A sorting domain-containing protein [Bacteroidota bacterium]|nr:T9SS type A sorting domain-containing protein [Bacteroidota bacterium]